MDGLLADGTGACVLQIFDHNHFYHFILPPGFVVGDNIIEVLLEKIDKRRRVMKYEINGPLPFSNHFQPFGLFYRHPTVADAEFLIDVFQVALDGLCGDKQFVGDLLVLQTLG